MSGEENLKGIVVERDVVIPMRDGIRLAGDIYRPEEAPKSDRHPVLLHRTPYGKTPKAPESRLQEIALYFAQQDYVSVVQDCRGRYGSQGSFTKYINEARDGYDTIEWLARLPYTTGDVGMWGTSYAAHVQADAAQLAPPHLKTIVLNMGGMSNAWDHAVRNHGAFEMKQLTWAFEAIRKEAEPGSIVSQRMKHESIERWIKAFPFNQAPSPLSISPNIEHYLLEMISHDSYDHYWRQMGLNWSEHYSLTSDIPMLHVSGWYDSYCGSAISNFSGLSKDKKGPIRLLMGPWLHGKNDESFAGDVEFGAEAAIGDFYFDLHQRWFDHFLKGKANELDTEPCVRLFIMGTGDGHRTKSGRLFHGGYWRDEQEWPPTRTQYRKFYFHRGGGLSIDKPESGISPVTYAYDPSDPVPTIGGSVVTSKPLFAGGAYDQREREYTGDPEKGFFGSKPPYLPLAARQDVAVFETAPLERHVEIVGPVKVILYVSSSAPDTDFTAKLIDVYPPIEGFPEGIELNLTDGILRSCFWASAEQPRALKPGRVYRLVIEPFPTANVFKKGHRVRVDISSSNFPRFGANPNTGDSSEIGNPTIVAHNSIHVDRRHPSHIVLPQPPLRQVKVG